MWAMKKFSLVFAFTLLLALPAFAAEGYFSGYNGGSGYNARSNYLSDYNRGGSQTRSGHYLNDFGGHGQNVTGRSRPSSYYSTSGAGRINKQHGRVHERLLRQARAQNAAQQRLASRAANRKCGIFSYCQRAPQLYRQGPSGNYARRNSVGTPSPVAVAVVLGQNPGMVNQRF